MCEALSLQKEPGRQRREVFVVNSSVAVGEIVYIKVIVRDISGGHFSKLEMFVVRPLMEIALDGDTQKVSLGKESPGLSFLTRGYRILFVVDIDSTP